MTAWMFAGGGGLALTSIFEKANSVNALHEAGKKAPQIELESELHVTDSCISKVYHIPAGVILGKHSHNYSHLSFLMSGDVVLHKGDDKIELKGPAIVAIDAYVLHAVQAVTDTVWACTHGASENDITKYENS
tara:strand:+ start:152 stop:550 length:399 start_codon:yes stop_codon:yes gene_type:complete